MVLLPHPVSSAACASVTDAGTRDVRLSSRATGPKSDKKSLGASLPPVYEASFESDASYSAFSDEVCFEASVLAVSVFVVSVLAVSVLAAPCTAKSLMYTQLMISLRSARSPLTFVTVYVLFLTQAGIDCPVA